jgi:uncharacterized membrane protein YbhN (UPF0104 family)
LFFYKSNPEIEILRMRVFPITAIGICFVSVFILLYIFTPIRDLIKSLIYSILRRIRPELNVESYFENYNVRKMNTRIFASVMWLSIVWQILFICRLLVLIKAASVPLGFMDITWIGSLVLLLQTIPVSFAGIGLREGAYAYLFTLFDLPPEKGVLIGILFFSQMLIVASVGGVLALIEQ